MREFVNWLGRLDSIPLRMQRSVEKWVNANIQNFFRHAELVSVSPNFQGVAGQARNDEINVEIVAQPRNNEINVGTKTLFSPYFFNKTTLVPKTLFKNKTTLVGI